MAERSREDLVTELEQRREECRLAWSERNLLGNHLQALVRHLENWKGNMSPAEALEFAKAVRDSREALNRCKI